MRVSISCKQPLLSVCARREWTGDAGQMDNIRLKRFKPVSEMILVGGGTITTTTD